MISSCIALTVISKTTIFEENKRICTKSGYCKFPFEYNDKTYTDCTKSGGYKRPWCYTEDSWGYCTPCKGT